MFKLIVVIAVAVLAATGAPAPGPVPVPPGGPAGQFSPFLAPYPLFYAPPYVKLYPYHPLAYYNNYKLTHPGYYPGIY